MPYQILLTIVFTIHPAVTPDANKRAFVLFADILNVNPVVDPISLVVVSVYSTVFPLNTDIIFPDLVPTALLTVYSKNAPVYPLCGIVYIVVDPVPALILTVVFNEGA